MLDFCGGSIGYKGRSDSQFYIMHWGTHIETHMHNYKPLRCTVGYARRVGDSHISLV